MRVPMTARLPLVFVLLAAWTPSASSSQDLPELNVGFVLGIPQGAFGRHLSGPAFGVGGFFGEKIPGIPLTAGFEGSLLVYGMGRGTQPQWDEDTYTTRGIATGHFVLRLQDLEQRVSPYADVLIGAKYLFTETWGTGGWWSSWSDPFGSTAAFDDLAFSYGLGGGVRFAWMTASDSVHGDRGRFTVHAGVRYLFGSRATYLTKTPNGDVAITSRTDMLVPQLGLTVTLW